LIKLDLPAIVDLPKYAGESEYPREFYANLEFRSLIVELGVSSPEAQQDLWVKCSRDILFWVNTFIYTYDPRLDPNVIPFISYPFQDKIILDVQDAIIDGEDYLIKKSRDMGLTWICLIVTLHFFIFKDRQSFLLLSRKEEMVDKTGDLDALMPKLDFMIEFLPKWMVSVDRRSMHLKNKLNGSVFDGDTMTADAGRGGRRTAVVQDEFASIVNGEAVNASTSSVTNCRIVPSTTKGRGTEFYKMESLKGIRKIICHWWLHPEKVKGAYRTIDGKLRSIWYDWMDGRNSRRIMAQEVDIDDGAAESQFFDATKIEHFRKNVARSPFNRGELKYERDDISDVTFMKSNTGRLLLWLYLGMDGFPHDDRRYVIGVDVSMGTGASNSVASILDEKTHDKVGEFATNTLTPAEFAKVVVALGRFFKGSAEEAFVLWEANGPGYIFGTEMQELNYSNFYYHTDDKSEKRKESDKPGWYSTKPGKINLLSQYQNAIESEPPMLVNYSLEAIEELEYYVYGKNGSVVHSQSDTTTDLSDTSANHGDRVIADSLAWKGIIVLQGSVYKPKEVTKTIDPNRAIPNTLSWRIKKYEEAQEEKSYGYC